MKSDFFTFGGGHAWEDVFFYQKWRIQRNYTSKKCRLLDNWDIRRHEGTFEECRKAFIKYIEAYELARQKGHMVIMIPGLGESKNVFKPLWREVLKDRFMVAAVNYPSTQKRIEENLSKAQQQFNSGIFKLGKNLYTDLKNQDWAALGLDIVNVMWGEVSQEQREVLSDWANKALEAINEAYSGGGLSEAFNAFKQIMSNGIKAEADGVTADVKGLSKIFQELGINVSDVGSKIMGVLGTIGTSMGNFAVNAGTKIAGLAGNMGSLGTIAEGVGGLIAKVGSLIISNPEVAAIIAIVAGVVALGVALFAKFGKGKSSGTTSTQKAYSYKDIQDAYWYGNERAFAGYDYRTDPYVMNPDNNAMLAYQAKMQAQMERLYGVVEKYLPEAGNSVIALDGEQVGRIITPSVNRSLGDLTVLSERGN